MKMDADAKVACTKAHLRESYCPPKSDDSSCDPYFKNNSVKVVRGIRGLTSGVIEGSQFYHSFIAHPEICSAAF